MHGSAEFNKLQRDMTPRDAVISFQCSSPDFVQVSETIDGESIHHREVQRHPDVVAEIEKRYIFFAKQADAARNQVMRGHSGLFSVYFREP
jgi:hypothetical protein